MMIFKGLSSFVLIGLLGWVMPTYGPWYLIAFAGFLGGLISRSQWHGLIIGFAAGYSLWLLQLTLVQTASQGDLPERMAHLLEIGDARALSLLTPLIGGVLASLGGAAGGALVGNRN